MRLSRRQLLRAGLALPLLGGLPRRARAATCDDGFPRRLVLFLWGNGNLPSRWTPEAEGPLGVLPEQLAALEPVKSKLTVVSGLQVRVENISPHYSGACGLLTGAQIDGTDADWTVAGPTLDQVVAEAIGGDTLYRSLQLGVVSASCFSWSGPNAQNFAETDPWALYGRLFGSSFSEPGKKGVVDPALAWRRSALDAVMADVAALQADLGAADRERLERHLDGVRELESRLQRLQENPVSLESCARPAEPQESYPEVEGRPQVAARSRAMADLAAMALACDQTRVLVFQLSPPVDNTLYTGVSDGHHTLTHDEPGDQPQVNAITLQIMDEFAYLLQALDAVPEGDGTLLDHSVVLAASETSEGRTHSLDEIPLLVAGGGCGRLVTGQHVRSHSQESATKAMLTVMRAMDVNLASWGEGDAEADEGFSPLEAE